MATLVSIPPVDLEPNAFIAFSRSGSEDILEVQYDEGGKDHAEVFQIDLDRDKLINQGIHLTKLFEEFRARVDAGLDLKSPKGVEALRECARAGQKAFRTCFKQKTKEEFEKLVNLLVRIFTKDARNVVKIQTRNVEKRILQSLTVPWELFHFPFERKSPPSNFSKFLGSRTIIVRDYNPVGLPGPVPMAPGNTIGLVVDRNLGLEVLPETKAIDEFASHFDCSIDRYELTDAVVTKTDQINSVIDFLLQGYPLYHFACHADHDDHKNGGSSFHVSKNIPVSLTDLEGEVDFQRALLFFNACSGARVNSRAAVSFATSFLVNNSARTVITTECKVDSEAAANFGKGIYDRLKEGAILWQALYDQRSFHLENNNPTGLLYSLHGDPTISFNKATSP